MQRRRSVGVTVLSIVLLILGLYILIYLVKDLIINKGLFWDFDLLIAMFGLGFFVSGLYIFKLKNWARILFLVEMGVLALVQLPLIKTAIEGKEFLESCFMSSTAVARNMLIAEYIVIILSIYFFTRPKVKEQFKQ